MTRKDARETTDSSRARRLLVPVSDTRTARETVDYAVRAADDGAVHLVFALSSDTETPEGEDERARGRSLLGRAQAWAHESAIDEELEIETAVVGEDTYLFGPEDYAAIYGSYAIANELDGVIVDPEFWVGSLGPMLAAFEIGLREHGLTVEEARAVRPARHERLPGGLNAAKAGTLFFISYAFYLTLGDPFNVFDLVTGAAVAAIVAVTLGHVTFGHSPTFPGSVIRTVRFAIYVPWLVWEIVKANVIIALVILHPSLPIDPRLTRVDAKVGGGLPLLALANSITLTPGTLSVRASDQRLLIHTLVPAAREDLFDGRLERAVRFVFYGRAYARIASPRERGDAEILPIDERS